MMEGQVRKLLGVLCILIAVASGGWKAFDLYMGGTRSDLRHIGDVSVSEGTTVKFADQDYELIGAGQISIVKPIVLQVNGILWLLSAILALAAGITLLTNGSTTRRASP